MNDVVRSGESEGRRRDAAWQEAAARYGTSGEDPARWRRVEFCQAAGWADETLTARFVEVLNDHWLAGIDCDHEHSLDRARCACSTVDLGWQANVGAAVSSWVHHVVGLL